MSKAVGILELSSIAKGMETGDAMLKSANVELLVSKTLCPGKFLLMLGGDVGAVQQAINSGASLAGEMLVDSLVLPNIHPSLLSAISGLNHVEQHRAVGVVETWSVAACIDAADCAVKAANVILVRVHMAFGIGGKCYMVVAGDISDVNNAVSVASERAGEKGLLVYRSVIARPHEATASDGGGIMTTQHTTERMIQEYVPGKQVTLAHVIANPGKDLFKKLGLPDTVSAIGILTITPSEASIIACDIATKSGAVEIGFLDRFTGTVVLTGDVSAIEYALSQVTRTLGEMMRFTACPITRT